MIIAVASGKGGTGETTVATNLAFVASRAGRGVVYLDCDVEEPNGAIFLKPQIRQDRPVFAAVPEVDLGNCTGCGKCEDKCPQKIPIRQQLKEAHKALTEPSK